MKKLSLLILITLLVTGCSIVRLDSESIDHIVDTIIKEDINLHNVTFEGYKYYLPKGVALINKTDYNAILLDNHNYYYLYVDVVSYYHEIEISYEINPDAYFSKKLSNQDKSGYLEINKSGNKYFVEAMYHYVKVEAYVNEDELEETVTRLMTILNSVQFNDSVLATLVGENILNYTEESIDIFQPKREESEFLEYEQEYIYRPKEGELPSEDSIQIEEEIK